MIIPMEIIMMIRKWVGGEYVHIFDTYSADTPEHWKIDINGMVSN